MPAIIGVAGVGARLVITRTSTAAPTTARQARLSATIQGAAASVPVPTPWRSASGQAA